MRLPKTILSTIAIATLLNGNDARAVCNLTYQGANAPVVTAPKIYLVLWGFGSPMTDPLGEVPYMQNALAGFPGWHWQSTDTQYYQDVSGTRTYISNSTGQFVATIVDNTRPLPADTAPTNVDAWRIAIANEALAVSNGVDRSANAIYVVATPPRNNYPEQNANACGFHGSISIPGTGTFLKWTDSPYNPVWSACYVTDPADPNKHLKNLTAVLLHEVMETITNPLGSRGIPAWVDTSCGAEIGDFCGTFTNAKLLPDSSSPNVIALPKLQSAVANSGAGTCVGSYTQNSYRFWANSSAGVDGYLYTSLGGNGCSTSGIWWDGVTLKNNVAAVSWGPARIDVFALDTNNHMQHLWTNDGGVTMYGGDDWGAGLSGWTLFGMPSAASWGPYHLDLFSLAKSGSSYALMHRMWNLNADGSVTFTGWENWGAPAESLGNAGTTTGVGAVSEENGRVDAFVLASTGSTANLWMAYRTGLTGNSSWASWGHPSGGVQMSGTPGVASWGPGRWDLFVPGGTGSSVHLHHWFYDASYSSGWDDWGTLPVSGGMNNVGPSVVAMGDNRLNVYVQGFAFPNNIYRRTWDFADLGWSSSLACSNPGSFIFCPQVTRF